MNTHERAIELARKLQSLAQRGEDGECTNADEMLRRFMKKHGLTEDELVAERLRECIVRYTTKEHKRFVGQVISSVLPHDRKVFFHRAKKWFVVEMSVAEEMEVIVKVDHYWKLLKEEEKLFYHAFIQANKLYSKSDPNKEDEDKEVSDEERIRLHRMFAMMSQIKTDAPAKRLAAKFHA